MSNLLAWFKFPIGEGAFFAGFGFVFVFAGIALLVVLFTLLGLAMKKINARKPKKKKVKGEKHTPAEESVKTEEAISPETVAVITAAIAAVYEGEKVKCDFVVRRIRKL